ncbi:MAG: hypothetical protein R2749_12485 [Acidimicrobiales bacterium]
MASAARKQQLGLDDLAALLDGDADAGGDGDVPARQRERAGERLLDAAGDGDGVLAVDGGHEQHGELVAAEPGDDVLGAHALEQAPGGDAEQLVAGLVAGLSLTSLKSSRSMNSTAAMRSGALLPARRSAR